MKKQAALTGDLLKEARVNIDSSTSGFPHVSISFNDAGAKLFDEVTAANVKKRLAIVLDNTIYSAPEIKERIGEETHRFQEASHWKRQRTLR